METTTQNLTKAVRAMEFELGQHVTGIYKTGKYIGEITNVRPQNYVMKVLAVQKHPQQGDLHHPKEIDVPLFHERRALAYREQVNIPKTQVRAFEGEMPTYEDTLGSALQKQIEDLEKDDSAWAEKSLEMLANLKQDYK
jgi:kinase-associated protein B